MTKSKANMAESYELRVLLKDSYSYVTSLEKYRNISEEEDPSLAYLGFVAGLASFLNYVGMSFELTSGEEEHGYDNLLDRIDKLKNISEQIQNNALFIDGTLEFGLIDPDSNFSIGVFQGISLGVYIAHEELGKETADKALEKFTYLEQGAEMHIDPEDLNPGFHFLGLVDKEDYLGRVAGFAPSNNSLFIQISDRGDLAYWQGSGSYIAGILFVYAQMNDSNEYWVGLVDDLDESSIRLGSELFYLGEFNAPEDQWVTISNGDWMNYQLPVRQEEFMRGVRDGFSYFMIPNLQETAEGYTGELFEYNQYNLYGPEFQSVSEHEPQVVYPDQFFLYHDIQTGVRKQIIIVDDEQLHIEGDGRRDSLILGFRYAADIVNRWATKAGISKPKTPLIKVRPANAASWTAYLSAKDLEENDPEGQDEGFKVVPERFQNKYPKEEVSIWTSDAVYFNAGVALFFQLHLSQSYQMVDLERGYLEARDIYGFSYTNLKTERVNRPKHLTSEEVELPNSLVIDDTLAIPKFKSWVGNQLFTKADSTRAESKNKGRKVFIDLNKYNVDHVNGYLYATARLNGPDRQVGNLLLSTVAAEEADIDAYKYGDEIGFARYFRPFDVPTPTGYLQYRELKYYFGNLEKFKEGAKHAGRSIVGHERVLPTDDKFVFLN
jgi:hypothetical protein